MTPAEIIEQLAEETEGQAIVYPNYEEALVGICRRFGQPPLALYSYEKCIEILMRDTEGEDLSEERRWEMAVEFFEFNSIGAWVGEYTPAFVYSGDL
jgi:hypothetical protein